MLPFTYALDGRIFTVGQPPLLGAQRGHEGLKLTCFSAVISFFYDRHWAENDCLGARSWDEVAWVDLEG